MYKKLIYIILIALAACSAEGTHEKATLCVSIEPQRKILEELAGDNFDIVTVLANGANPETYDPSVAQRMATNRSAAYFITGYLPFEEAIAQGLSPEVKIANTSTGIHRLTGTHSHGGEGHAEEVDPHVWTSIKNAKIMANNMAKTLAEIDPDNAQAYRSRLEKLSTRLDSLDTVTAARLDSADVHAFMVWHPSLSYFAHDYGLHQIAVGQESKEQSVGNLRDIINEAREDSVRVFFFQKEYDSRQAESINKEIGARLVTINPLAYDWEAEMVKITDELTK